MMDSQIRRIARDNEAWRKANPWTIHNVGSCGTRYGRFASQQEAEQAIRERGTEPIGVDGRVVLFREQVFC